jgi:serine/threonine-protein kinase
MPIIPTTLKMYLLAASLVAGSTAGLHAASRSVSDTCFSRLAPDEQRITACSAVIRSGAQQKHAKILALLERAGAYGRKGEYRRVIADSTKAIQAEPSATAYYTRALAHQNLGDDEQAIRDCDAALAIEPQSENALFVRGSARQDLGDYSGAIKDFSEVLRLNPVRAQALFARGTTYYSAGNYRSAVDDFSKTLDLGHADAVVFEMRALAEAALGNFSDARADFEKASSTEHK